MYADVGSLAWNNPVRWSARMKAEELLVDLRGQNFTEPNRPVYVWVNFSEGYGDWVKCRNNDCAEQLIQEKIVAVTEGWEAFSCAEDDFVQLPHNGAICRAWYGKEGYHNGPRGVDVTTKCRELYKKQNKIFANNGNFGDPQPGKAKILYIEFVREPQHGPPSEVKLEPLQQGSPSEVLLGSAPDVVQEELVHEALSEIMEPLHVLPVVLGTDSDNKPDIPPPMQRCETVFVES